MSWTIAGRYVQAAATDPDAQAYLQAVEAADGQALEFEVARAIDNFVLGCKADGIWDAIKASCILAGARTLDGALVPLVGTAPTNYNFVSGDYNRETGLKGDGSTKYLDSNRAGNADPQNNVHFSVYKSSGTTTGAMIGSLLNVSTNSSFNFIDYFASGFRFTCRGTISSASASAETAGFFGASRSLNAAYVRRLLSSSTSVTGTSAVASSNNFFVFNRSGNNYFDSSRLAFYSIGESLDLALLDARVSTLMSDLAAAIP